MVDRTLLDGEVKRITHTYHTYVYCAIWWMFYRFESLTDTNQDVSIYSVMFGLVTTKRQ